MRIERRTNRTARLLGALLAVSACSGARAATNETAGEFVVRELGYALKHQSAREYAVLIPAQRAVVTETQFEDYVPTDIYPPDATVKVIHTYPDATDIPGTSLRRLRATAVTVQITGGGQVVTRSVHAYLVDGRWYWAMTSYALIEAQTGPGAPSSLSPPSRLSQSHVQE